MEFPPSNNPISPEDTEFLRNTDTDLTEQASELAYIRNKYAQEAAELWGKATAHKYYIKEVFGWAVKLAMQQEGTLEKGKLAAPQNTEYKKAIADYIAFETRKRQLEAYITSLDYKGNFIPGMQGRENRELDFENSTEY